MVQITLPCSGIIRILTALAVALVLASVAGQIVISATGEAHWAKLVSFFDLDEEENIPTFFSVFLLVIAAFLCGLTAALAIRQKAPHIWHWKGLSAGFMIMAYDEAFHIHEKCIVPIRTWIDRTPLGVLYFSWVVPGFALTFLIALFFFRFIVDLPAKTRSRFLISALVYLGGSLGLELLGGLYAEQHGENNLFYNFIATVEESLEMAGLILFIRSLLAYLGESAGSLMLNFKNAHTPSNPSPSQKRRMVRQSNRIRPSQGFSKRSL